jgi:hypothetical protein
MADDGSVLDFAEAHARRLSEQMLEPVLFEDPDGTTFVGRRMTLTDLVETFSDDAERLTLVVANLADFKDCGAKVGRLTAFAIAVVIMAPEIAASLISRWPLPDELPRIWTRITSGDAPNAEQQTRLAMLSAAVALVLSATAAESFRAAILEMNGD